MVMSGTALNKLLLDREEAMEALNIRSTTLQSLIATGAIRSVQIGRRRLIPVDALREYVERLEAEAVGA